MSMGNLLMHYLRLAVREAHLARVPNQLVSDSGQEGDEDVDQDVNEFSGVGAIMGYSGPLGGESAEHPTASVGKKRKHRRRR